MPAEEKAVLRPAQGYTLTGKTMRRHGLRSLISIVALVTLTAMNSATFAAAQAAPASPQSPARPAQNMTAKKLTPAEVQQSAIVIDTHADTPQRFLDEH